ncbi:glycine--tRNA ligase subunit alpha [Candidatus Hydrogenosomobacter endosymbioticus]|uniref:Glycine--tRNA ligase alpha subunit n=1 Tax=Candidatus Hydrogenosomobacter endosymbioticus TaxID=2558174 RepID=A0ABM7V9C2_9PROT|nr:glycine--tRNA ligase subunit alpha [Candidatus Hydrogenosomobacter endosymbioticus]BDB96066.1 glycine--tRNA ligase alpha subunit [Candidatus Hydrogenosomobacter endosymbioticus]
MAFSFQDIIFSLQKFWADVGCAVMQPFDVEMGAATFHPATSLYTLSMNEWRVAFVQPCRRPQDGRYGENPNRFQKYFQFQVIIKPSPSNIQEQLLDSFECLGIDLERHDVRFVEDDWQSPTLGASGLGWEVWLDGMEVVQLTYFQQIGGISCFPVAVEVTYGLERLAMNIQKKESVFDIVWNGNEVSGSLLAPKCCANEGYYKTYGELFMRQEQEFSVWNFEEAPIEDMESEFQKSISCARVLLGKNVVLPAFELCIKASHLFNLLESRKVISVAQRAGYIQKIRSLACLCCEKWKNSES